MKTFDPAESKLARLLEHAAATPFYDGLMGGDCDGASPAERLARLPVVSRRKRASRPSDFLSRTFVPDARSREAVDRLLSAEALWDNEQRATLPNGKSVVLEKTSGSTGNPLKMLKADIERMRAGKSVWELRRRVDPAITPATMFPFEHAPLDFEFPYDLGDYSPGNVGNCLREIGRRGYTWLHGHPQGLEWWAEIVEEHPDFRYCACFRYIESNGSRLTASARAKIEAAFQCPVLDNYNCREVWTIGYECRSGSMHIAGDCVVVEILRDDGTPAADGEQGSVVVTGLLGYAMPFIRYELGDRLAATAVECPCGTKGRIIRSADEEADETITGSSLSGGEVFSKVTRFLYGSFSYQYDAIRVLETDCGEFEVWVGGFRGEQVEFTERFAAVSAMLLDPFSARFDWHFVDRNAPVFAEHPRVLFVSMAVAAV